jgi:hypothetical protein
LRSCESLSFVRSIFPASFDKLFSLVISGFLRQIFGSFTCNMLCWGLVLKIKNKVFSHFFVCFCFVCVFVVLPLQALFVFVFVDVVSC